jgi:hypothetical protein
MGKSSHWGHTKITLENRPPSEGRKDLQEFDKQEYNFKQILDNLKQNARREADKDSKDHG